MTHILLIGMKLSSQLHMLVQVGQVNFAFGTDTTIEVNLQVLKPYLIFPVTCRRVQISTSLQL